MNFRDSIELKMTPTNYVLLSLVFLSQLVLHSAQELEQTRGCPSFRCGNLGKVGFPFSNITNPECGLSLMNCTGPEPKVQFRGQAEWRTVYSFNNLTRTIEIKLRVIPTQFFDSNASCHLESNFTRQVSPSLFINVTETRPSFKCKKPEPHQKSTPNFLLQFTNYTDCKHYDLYYHPSRQCLPSLPETLSNRCLVVHLPSTSLQSNQSCLADNLNLSWDGIIRINWEVRPVCLDCRRKGGQCQTKLDGTFNCGNLKKGFMVGRRRLLILIGKVVLTKLRNGSVEFANFVIWNNNMYVSWAVYSRAQRCVSIGVVGIFLTSIIFIIYQCRKRKKLSRSSSLISRDICNDTSLKTDLDHGSIYFQTPIFTYKELREATNHFDSNKKLGDGGFGTVYHGILHDGRTVAVKRLFEHNFKRVEQFMNEIEILSRLSHPNLVSLYGCTSRNSRELLLVYEYVANGTVADHLHGDHANDGFLTWPIRMRIAVESADALAYLHASDIIHRDIKSNNILLDHGFHVKVGDFGLSRLFPTDVTHVSTSPQGTPGYVDPAYYQCYQLNDKSDVYSFGVFLIELISSKAAVDTSRPLHEINLANMAIDKIYNQALHELVDPTLGFDSDYSTRNMIILVAELAFRCLQQEKEMRPFMTEVLEILRGIEREYMMKKADEIEVSTEARLLNNIQPFSPDSVTNKWISTSTTPNTSG